MYAVEVVTRWTESGGRREAEVVTRCPGAWTDATGQPDANLNPDPNAVVWRGVVDAAVLDALEADADVLVLWSEGLP
jgi:hypothetical protein